MSFLFFLGCQSYCIYIPHSHNSNGLFIYLYSLIHKVVLQSLLKLQKYQLIILIMLKGIIIKNAYWNEIGSIF